MKKRILVVSSANMDFVMNVSRLPFPGETVIEKGEYELIPGGKGGNSALAVERLGGDCVFCAKLGRDANGEALRALYASEGINLSALRSTPDAPTGLAAITVENDGTNRISIFPGANAYLNSDDAEEALLCYPDALLMQFEIPDEAILTAAHFAAKKNIPIVIDAGPARPDFPFDRLPPLEIFSPNEVETEIYTGINPNSADNALRAAVALQKIVKSHYYVIKLGNRGALVYDGKYYNIASPYEVKAVDTTAAGDSFTAALTLEYLRSGNIMRAARYANAVGAMVVSRLGASSSIPNEKQLSEFIAARGIEL
ncbi:MAG: ribokinase [Ruminococcaceae bacterium]|nr:ribokinase [Oscillospiraceae bacterium]